MMRPEPVSLLLVDDSPDNLLALEAVARSAWADVSVASVGTAGEGLAAALVGEFDGALVDVHMPDMDGIEMCRRLKADERTAELPVILITSLASSADLKAQGLIAGADDFITRPIDNVELIARMRVMLRLRRTERALRASHGRLEEKVREKTRELQQSRDRLRALYRHATRVREDERISIARDVHDELGQQLAAAIVEVGRLRTGEGDTCDKVGQELEATLQQCIRSVRRICQDLRPEALDSQGLAGAVAFLGQDFQRRYGLLCKVNISDGLPRLSPEVETALFRIVQECLSNVKRHARADSVSILFRVEGDMVVLEIADDGIGPPPDIMEMPGHYGLQGVGERVRAMSGRFGVYGDQPGTRVSVAIPVAPSQG